MSSISETLQSFVEMFTDCGTGAGGFKPGNTCANGGKGKRDFPDTPKVSIRKPSEPNDQVIENENDISVYASKVISEKLNSGSVFNLCGALDGSKVLVSKFKNFAGEGLRVASRGNDDDWENLRFIMKSPSGEKYIKNTLFEIKKPELRGKGIGLEVLGRQIEEAIEHGFSYMETLAARFDSKDPAERMNGYEVWPKYGYDGDIPEDYAGRLPDSLKHAKRISDLYKTKEGREWWKRYGGDVELKFDLTEGSLSRRVWEAYVEERKKKGTFPTQSRETTNYSIGSGTTLERMARTDIMSSSEDIEDFAYSGENCGIGSKGFEKGNKCAVSKGGKRSDAPKVPTNAREAAKYLKSLKAGKVDAKAAKPAAKASAAKPEAKPAKPEKQPTKEKPAPPSSGPSDRRAAATKPKEDASPKVKPQPDSIASGTVPPKQEGMSDRAEKALKYHKPVTTQQKAIAKDREQDVAAGLGGQWLPDHEPVDVIVLDENGEEIGIEVKTTFDNTRGSLTIDAAANLYKVDWRKDRKGTKTRIDIVVCDDKTGDMYYKRGVGSFTFSGMYKVPGGYKGGMEHLKKLVAMKESDKDFPAEAKYQKDTINHVALIDKLTYGVLKKQALDAKLAKDARRAKSKEKMKGQK